MKAFFSSLLYASLIGGIGALLVGKPYKRHFQSLAALLCCALTAYPLLNLLPSIDFKLGDTETLSADTAAAQGLVLEQAAEDAANEIDNYIYAQTGINTVGTCISFESKDEVFYIASVCTSVQTEAEAATVRALLGNAFDNGVEIEVKCEA